jgi:type IV pilus biogenesis protein CpaD/CtpE
MSAAMNGLRTGRRTASETVRERLDPAAVVRVLAIVAIVLLGGCASNPINTLGSDDLRELTRQWFEMTRRGPAQP